MSRPGDGGVLGWMFAILLLLVVIAHMVTGCQAFAAAAPILLETVDRVIADEIERARGSGDRAREFDLVDAQQTLAETRDAAARAEAAAKAATEAAVRAEVLLEQVASEQEKAERAREERARKRLARKLAKLQLVRAPAEQDAGVDGTVARPDR